QSITSRGIVGGTIWAGQDIGTIAAGGSVFGWITAVRDIAKVQAGVQLVAGPPAIADVMTTQLYAGRNIGTISASGAVRPALITANTGSIQNVTGGLSINSTIHAAQNIGQVIAGSQTNPGEGTTAVVSGSIDA